MGWVVGHGRHVLACAVSFSYSPTTSFLWANKWVFLHILLLLTLLFEISLSLSLSLWTSFLVSDILCWICGAYILISPYITSLCSHFWWFSLLSQYKKFSKVRIYDFCIQLAFSTIAIPMKLLKFKADNPLSHVLKYSALGWF